MESFDTGNVYIAGHDPAKFLQRCLPRVSHVHFKDLTPTLEEPRGKDTGIGLSTSAIGGEVNADGIRRCVEMLKKGEFSGGVVLECDARGGPLMKESLAWFRKLLDDLADPHELEYPQGGRIRGCLPERQFVKNKPFSYTNLLL